MDERRSRDDGQDEYASAFQREDDDDDAERRPAGGGVGTMMDDDGTTMTMMHRLASDACSAIEGDDVDSLYAILDVVTTTTMTTTTDVDVDDAKCRAILGVFERLIGGGNRGGTCRDGGGGGGGGRRRRVASSSSVVPRCVKAHLLLRAMLRLPHDVYTIPW
jgi:hypothetical protein